MVDRALQDEIIDRLDQLEQDRYYENKREIWDDTPIPETPPPHYTDYDVRQFIDAYRRERNAYKEAIVAFDRYVKREISKDDLKQLETKHEQSRQELNNIQRIHGKHIP